MVDLTDEMGGPERGSEAGLLGLTFSPDGDRLYLSDTQFQHDADRTFVNFQRRVLEFRMDGDVVDLSSRRTILDLQKNFSHHNAGEVRFGADGYLYVSIGDGSDSGLNDDRETGQDPTDLFGGLLRIDPLDPPPGKAYAIPPDNPYDDAGEGAPEVWLFGTRNPWRFSFDRQTGDLWVSDVGEGSFEEINLLRAEDDGRAGAAANLGWSAMEGPEPFADRPRPPDALDPLLAYPHGDRCAVIGGYRYRGLGHPRLGRHLPVHRLLRGPAAGSVGVRRRADRRVRLQLRPRGRVPAELGRGRAGRDLPLDVHHDLPPGPLTGRVSYQSPEKNLSVALPNLNTIWAGPVVKLFRR